MAEPGPGATSAPAAAEEPAAAPANIGDGTEDRDWVTGQEEDPSPAERFDYETSTIWVTMRDGIQLEAELRVPDLPDTAGPCVLVANGYGWDSGTGDGMTPQIANLAERGYATLHVSLRGSGNSEGEGNLYNEFGHDGYDLVEWMAAQSWCDGNVGMIGASLLGISQWQTADEAPPHLKAIIPYVACGDCYEYLWYPGGMLPGPGRVARGEPEYTSALAHRTLDSWWEQRTTQAVDHQQIANSGIAVMNVGGWVDYISAANVRAHEEFSAADGEGFLIEGPWAHGVGPGDEEVGPYDFETYQALWMDRVLRGEDYGVTDRGEALIFVQGPDAWRFEEEWPIPDTRDASLYLHDDPSGSIDSLNDGSLRAALPSSSEPVESYSYDPEAGPFLPTFRDSGLGLSGVEQQGYEEAVLTWTTGELTDSVEVTGWPTLSFWAEANGDTDFVVQITDVAPDGTATHVSSGYLNASLADSRSTWNEPEAGQIREYQVEVQPTSYVFQEGHRLRVDIAGGAEPTEDQTAPQGPGKNPAASEVTIYQSAEYAAELSLPVIGTGKFPSEPRTDRLQGEDRWETSANIAGEFGDTDVAYLASGQMFPDALAGSAAAVVDEAPVLLTKQDSLPNATEAALGALNPETVYVLGGPEAVSEEVLAQAQEAAPGAEFVRIAGDNRYHTASELALAAFADAEVDTVYVATGEEFADSLTVGPLAGLGSSPILLTKSDAVPATTIEALQALQPTNIFVLGGEERISPAVYEALAEHSHSIDRLAGVDRYETAVEIAGHVPESDLVFIASGEEFPDALSGAALAGYHSSPLLLVRPDHLPAATSGELTAGGYESARLFGGVEAITTPVQDLIEAAIE